ncbi:MAG: hypothetical protein ABIB11_03800, partial [Candidatus Omnitrophota bacterium]
MRAKRLFIIWFFVLVCVTAAHLLSLDISPTINPDEAIIIDYGRQLIEPADWSVNWFISANRPLFFLSYIGPLIQEAAFRVSGLSLFGPRIASLFGALLAASLLLLWFLARKIPKLSALMLASLFLIDPLFTSSYRGGRVDCWVMVLCFSACLFLRYAAFRLRYNKPYSYLVALAGCFGALSVFIWPSAIIILPLILYELFVFSRQLRLFAKGRRMIFLNLFIFASGGLLTTAVLLFAVRAEIGPALNGLSVLTDSAVGYKSGLYYRLMRFLPTRENVFLVAESFRLTPVLPLAVICAIIFCRKKLFILTFVIAYAFVVYTGSYWLRTLYLFPYFFGLISAVYLPLKIRVPKIYRKGLRIGILLFLFIWAFGITLIIRPGIALSQKEERNPKLLLEVASSLIGPGPVKVLDATYRSDFYYAGRLLNV